MLKLAMSKVGDFRDLLDLPVVFSGTEEQCQRWASEHGFTGWRSEPNYLYGGYWISKNGDTLLPI